MKKLQFDVLKDPPGKVMLLVMLPLLAVNGIALLTTAFTNELYSRSIGPLAFTVTALVSTLIGVLQNVVGGVVSAAWIRTALSFQKEDVREAENRAVNAVYAVAGITVMCCGLLLVLTEPLLSLLQIPAQVRGAVRQYYRIYVGGYLLSAVSSYFLSVVNGVCSVAGIFWANLLSSCGSALTAGLLVALLGLGVPGLALVAALTALLVVIFAVCLLRRRGLRFGFEARRYRPDLRLIGSILRYGLLLALQSVLCNAGYLAVSVQTNRLLPLNYITVLSVSLPLTGVMSAFSAACAVFVPVNHAAGQRKRTRAFLWLATVGCTGYGVLCFLAFALLGRWYYARLFDSAAVVAYGAAYWRIYGFGLIFVAVIFVVRIFLESVRLGGLSLLSGGFELLGNLISAFWLIPRFGVVGRSLSYPLGWSLAAAYLLIVCVCMRRRLFEEGPAEAQGALPDREMI